jgi:hypothetical protein
MASKKTGVEVVQASYGAQGNFQDVTKEVQAMVKDGNLNFTVSSQSIGILDPAPGIKKTFQIKTITNGGTPVILSKDDGEVIAVSAPSVKSDKPRHALNILSSIGYALICVLAVYFGVSAYRLASEGMNNKILGVILLLMSLLTIGYTGFMAVPIIVFTYAFLWPTSINFAYAKNAIEKEIL